MDGWTKACSFFSGGRCQNDVQQPDREEVCVSRKGASSRGAWSVHEGTNHRVQRAHDCFRRNSQVMYGRRQTPLDIKVHVCMTLPSWRRGTQLYLRLRHMGPEIKMHYRYVQHTMYNNINSKLRTADLHLFFLLRCSIGWKKRERTDRLMPYADTVTKTGCDGVIEAIARKCRLLLHD